MSKPNRQEQPQTDPGRICILRSDDSDAVEQRANKLAASLNLKIAPFKSTGRTIGQDGVYLEVAAQGLTLLYREGRNKTRVAVDFHSGKAEHRRKYGGGKGQLIAKAIGVGANPPRVLDATAGLARDAFVLASLGCRVIAAERSALLCVLLYDALKSASEAAQRATREAAGRIQVVQADARSLLRDSELYHKIDVIYIDPMYPDSTKSTALVRKEMRICRMVVGNDKDAAQLLNLAMSVHNKRVVVKRMHDAPPLGESPASSLTGKSTRFDIYLT